MKMIMFCMRKSAFIIVLEKHSFRLYEPSFELQLQASDWGLVSESSEQEVSTIALLWSLLLFSLSKH